MTAKIAVPFDNGNIFQHFGKTETFKIYTVEDGKVASSEVLEADSLGHELLVIWLVQNEVRAVICGSLGPSAFGMLTAANITVFAGVEGSADEAVAKLLSGELQRVSVHNCACDEGSSCGGGCAHCGHHCH